MLKYTKECQGHESCSSTIKAQETEIANRGVRGMCFHATVTSIHGRVLFY